MKYDIEFVIPITFKDKFLQRAIDFKKIGLLNINNNKVLVNFLVGTEAVPKDFLDGFNYDVRIIDSTYNVHSNKVSDFYSKLNPDKLDSRWIARIDDDSLTDVSGLLYNLDNEFDYKKEYNIITDYKLEVDTHEFNILSEMGYGRWFGGRPTVAHEWECGILSHGALKTMLLNKNSIEFLNKRTNFGEGFCDQCISIAARMAKIYPVDGWFLTQFSEVFNFSLFEGTYNHIHYIARDIDSFKFDFLNEMLTSERKLLQNKDFAFYVNNKPVGILTFAPNGKIKNYHHENEAFWSLRKNDLIIFNKDGIMTCEYKDFLKKQQNCFGNFINQNIKVLLKLIT